ncbi:MAG: serine hydrolase [Maribacter sp.]|uniref:serine hydrolase n=1 Tax=Maribacter sp. TaxID=1897614 RepID=UPI003C70C103
MKKTTILFLFVALTYTSFQVFAQTQEQQFDALLQETYTEGTPGVAALVYKEGTVLYRKAFGMANLELDVPMKPNNVFEIGSITKQFTAVSILLLIEQGKLKLNDEITKYLPDFPTHNKKITIHHLLNHTSGIKSYTSMPSFMGTAATDKTPIEIINVFKDQPMDFDPGEKWLYNNSGYIILGYIIEEISGKSYADFIQEHIFGPLEMKNSYYGSKSTIIKNRATGYSPAENGFQNAKYLSMTLPYAAGSLMSTVDDMLLWHKAIHNNSLISANSKALAFTNTTLNNGDLTNYGYGWQMNEISGVLSIEHGGGIFGYVTHGVYVPSENVYVITLTNRDGVSPQDATVKIAAIAMEKPYPEVDVSVSLSNAELNAWVGNYEFDDQVLRTISLEDGQLYSQREGSEKLMIYADSATKFHFEDGLSTYAFKIEDGKKVAHFKARINESKGIGTDRKPGTEKEEISVDTSNYDDYVGSYELVPGFAITITNKDNQLFAQATGQQNFPIFPEAEDTFFYKVVSAQLVFERNDAGEVINVTLNQNGQSLKGDKK